MNLPYYPHYFYIRVRPTHGFGYLADPSVFHRLVATGRSIPAEAFLIDAGDAHSEAAHVRAKLRQIGDAYTRERLQAPRFSYFDESGGRTEDHDQPLSGSPFLDLVLGGGPTLFAWYQGHTDSDPGLKVSIAEDPRDLHCHTPLNQRIHPASMRMCQELTEAADTLLKTFPDGTAGPVLAAGCFFWLTNALDLDREQRAELSAFGLDYLSRYLEYAGTGTPLEVLTRRVEHVRHAAGITATAALRPGHPQTSLSGLAVSTDNWFFPESVWMQFHWLVSSLPVDLVQELALAEALLNWVTGDGNSHGTGTR